MADASKPPEQAQTPNTAEWQWQHHAASNESGPGIMAYFAMICAQVEDVKTCARAMGLPVSFLEQQRLRSYLSSLKELTEQLEQDGTIVTGAYDRNVNAAAPLPRLAPCFDSERPIVTMFAVQVAEFGFYSLLHPAMLSCTLGFAEPGPIPGSAADRWWSKYGGQFPYGEMVAYFQRVHEGITYP